MNNNNFSNTLRFSIVFFLALNQQVFASFNIYEMNIRDKKGGDIIVSYYTNIIECVGSSGSTNGIKKKAKEIFTDVKIEESQGFHLTKEIKKPVIEYNGRSQSNIEDIAESMRVALWSGKYIVVKGNMEEHLTWCDDLNELDLYESVQKYYNRAYNPLKNMPIDYIDKQEL